MPAAARLYMSSLSTFDYLAGVTNGVLNLTGAVLLFLLRRQAFYFFLSAFILGLLTSLHQILTKNLLSALEPTSWIGMFLGWLTSLGIIVYTLLLVGRRVLR